MFPVHFDLTFRRLVTGLAALVATAIGFWFVLPTVSFAQNAQSPQIRGGTGYGNGAGSTGRLQREDLPSYHVVQEGETLWDLSARFYGDERTWPRLWSYNPHITNPHYIYPGDIVYLSAPPEPSDQQATTSDGEDSSGMEPSTTEPGIHLATAGFVRKDTPTFVGRIAASPKNARLLGQHDTVWVGFGEDGYTKQERDNMKSSEIRDLREPDTSVQKGDRFAVLEVGEDLTDSDNNVIGTKYFVVGSISITKTSDENFQTANVDQSWREFQRGALLVPYGRQLRAVTKVPAETDLVGEIIGGMPPKLHYGQFDYVFLNRGASDGVRIGNRFYIYHRKEGLSNEWDDVPDQVPWRRVGRIRVLDITEEFATGVVMQSDREFNVGDRVEMYKGN
jgi:hypothetical protein